jgi:hypothetical protein
MCARSLGLSVLQDYTKLKADTQAKNIAAWTPVVAEILHGFCKFDDKAVCPFATFPFFEATKLTASDDSSPDTFPQSTLSRRSYWPEILPRISGMDSRNISFVLAMPRAS